MDKDTKDEFANFCTDVGMNITTAINLFARYVVREQKFPFEIDRNKRISEADIITTMRNLSAKGTHLPEELLREEIMKIKDEEKKFSAIIKPSE
jgi:DNA-damage-inducible protein J